MGGSQSTNCETLTALTTLGTNIGSLALAPDMSFIAVGGFARIYILNPDNFSVTQELTLRFHFQVHQIYIEKDMSAMWTLTIKELVKWDLKGFAKLKEIHLKEYPMQSMHPMNDQVIIASESHAWWYNLQDRQKSTQILLNDVEDARFSHRCDQEYIISTGFQFDIRVYNSRNGFIMNTFKGHKEAIQCVDTNFNYTTLATGSADGTVKLWALTRDESHLIQTLRAHDQGVAAVKFVVFPDRIISTSLNGWIKIWDLENYTVLTTLKIQNEKFANLRHIQITPDGSQAYIACWHNRTIYKYRIGSPKSYLIYMRYFKLNKILKSLPSSLFRDLFKMDAEWDKVANKHNRIAQAVDADAE